MSYPDPNIYYSPDHFGLRQVAEMEWDTASYCFDTTVVWRDEDGRYYVASDAGCSCPSPFEYIKSRDELPQFDSPFKVLEYVHERMDDITDDRDRIYAQGKFADLATAPLNDE